MKVAVVAFASLIVFVALAETFEDANSSDVARVKFELPKVFDFARFKQLFDKHYSSLLEELARKRIFLARAFNALLSAVAYKYRKRNSYLSINHRSDWTQSERDKFLHRKAVRAESDEQVADEAQIAQTLSQIRERKGDSDLGEIAQELQSSMAPRRQRRSVVQQLSDVRSFSLDQLMKAPREVEQIELQVESNNPDYEAPELDTCGVEKPTSQSGMSDAFANLLLKLGPRLELNALNKSPEKSLRLAKPDQVWVDHRDKKCLSQPRDQEDCGACYVFSVIALYEYLHCMQTGKLIAFSEQYSLDCGSRVGMKGCDGGSESQVANFVRQFGLELRHKYPFKGFQDQCPYNHWTDPKFMGYLKVEEPGLIWIPLQDFESRLARDGPLLVGVKATDEFLNYGGGVDPMLKCQLEGEDHAVLLVGHGRQDGRDYWLIRNSYGADWGEQGYYKLDKSSDCFSDGRRGRISQVKFGSARNPNHRRAVEGESRVAMLQRLNQNVANKV